MTPAQLFSLTLDLREDLVIPGSPVVSTSPITQHNPTSRSASFLVGTVNGDALVTVTALAAIEPLP